MLIEGNYYPMKRFYRYVQIATALLDKPRSSFKHFTFMCDKSRIISIGWNNTYKDSEKINGRKFRYPLGGVHAEAAAIGRLDDLNLCRRATLVNIRLNRQGELRNSKPCAVCMALLANLGIPRIYHTTENGFELIKL